MGYITNFRVFGVWGDEGSYLNLSGFFLITCLHVRGWDTMISAPYIRQLIRGPYLRI